MTHFTEYTIEETAPEGKETLVLDLKVSLVKCRHFWRESLANQDESQP